MLCIHLRRARITILFLYEFFWVQMPLVQVRVKSSSAVQTGHGLESLCLVHYSAENIKTLNVGVLFYLQINNSDNGKIN